MYIFVKLQLKILPVSYVKVQTPFQVSIIMAPNSKEEEEVDFLLARQIYLFKISTLTFVSFQQMCCWRILHFHVVSFLFRSLSEPICESPALSVRRIGQNWWGGRRGSSDRVTDARFHEVCHDVVVCQLIRINPMPRANGLVTFHSTWVPLETCEFTFFRSRDMFSSINLASH